MTDNEKKLIHKCAELRKRIAELESIISDFLDCPMILDQATVPMAGIDTAPNQVVFNFCCSYSKILAARQALEKRHDRH